MRRTVLVLLAGLLATGCAPAPGEQVAARIRAAGSPVVREVIFRPANMLDPATIDVWLRPGTTEAHAEALWCEVIAPAGGSYYEGDTGVAVWTTEPSWTAPEDPGSEMVVLSPTCPAPSK